MVERQKSSSSTEKVQNGSNFCQFHKIRTEVCLILNFMKAVMKSNNLKVLPVRSSDMRETCLTQIFTKSISANSENSYKKSHKHK